MTRIKSRDDFPVAIKRKLAARAGHLCSNTDCRASTSGPQSVEDQTVNVGVACHISAAAAGGPRYDAGLTEKERAGIANSIWLCQTCAKLIDSDERRYTAHLLRQWKARAEREAHHSTGKAKPAEDPRGQSVVGKVDARPGSKVVIVNKLFGDLHMESRRPAAPPTYITAPPTVANYIDRPEAVRALRDVLLAEDGSRAIALTALHGMGGIGKTVLAQALFNDEAVRRAFPDGRVWVTVGRDSAQTAASRLLAIATALGSPCDDTDDAGDTGGAIAPETLYRTAIAGKAALIVIDDIWSRADLDPFLADSPRSRFLFTTRDASIARFSGAREHRVDLLDAAQSRELLALWAGLQAAQLPPAAGDVLAQCGRLPLALSTVGALLRGAPPAYWADTADLLRAADLAAIEDQLPPGQQSFFRAIDVSVKALEPKLQQRYAGLAVLLEDMPAELPVLRTLWNVGEAEARRVARQLAGRSLALQDEATSAIRLHDLQLDYLRAQYPDRAALHLIHGAVRLSAHVLAKDPSQFASQVTGRLLPHRQTPAIRQFVDQLAAGARPGPGCGRSNPRWTLRVPRCCALWKATLLLSMAWR